jgi:hypothetical protein
MAVSTEQEPTIEERIKKLHEEIDAVVAKYVDERAAQVPGVHRGSVESSILARANDCRCAEFRLVEKIKADAEELVRKAYALPEG